MPIKIKPPATSTLFGALLPSLFPKRAPRNDSVNVTAPMTVIAVRIEIFMNAKLNPAARASMLVAMDRSSRV